MINKEFRKRVAQGLDRMVAGYDTANKRTFNEPQKWDDGFGRTVRHDGSVVFGSTRNIVDTGELRDSQSVEKTGELSRALVWSDSKAVDVYFGQVRTDGSRIPGRPWAEKAIDEEELRRDFSRGFIEG